MLITDVLISDTVGTNCALFIFIIVRHYLVAAYLLDEFGRKRLSCKRLGNYTGYTLDYPFWIAEKTSNQLNKCFRYKMLSPGMTN